MGDFKSARAIQAKIIGNNPSGYYSTIILASDEKFLDEQKEILKSNGFILEDNQKLSYYKASREFQEDPSLLDVENSEVWELASGLTEAGSLRDLSNAFDLFKLGKISKREGNLVANLASDYNSFSVVQKWNRLNRTRYPDFKKFSDMVFNMHSENSQWSQIYPVAYKDTIIASSDYLGVDPLFVLSVMRAESRYRQNARSPVGARGLLQIMPYTAKNIAAEISDSSYATDLDLFEPKANIIYGSFYLSKLTNMYKGNFYLALAAYNAGPAKVNEWIDSCADCSTIEFIESIPFQETRKYVKKITRYYAQYLRIYRKVLAPDYHPDLSYSTSYGPIY